MHRYNYCKDFISFFFLKIIWQNNIILKIDPSLSRILSYQEIHYFQHSEQLITYCSRLDQVLHLNANIYLSIYLSLHRVPKDVGSMNKSNRSIPILSNPICLKEGAASNDIIFPSLPWSSLSVGTRDHFHKNAFGKTHVAHSANMTKPGQLWFSDASKDPLGFKFAGGNS